MLIGLVGCFLPILPGPPLGYLGLLMLQLKEEPPFTFDFLLLWAGITAGVFILDYVIPIYGTKKLGGSKRGIYGSVLGLIVGLFFAPFGIIIGPILGAIIGELSSGKETKEAIKTGLGSFMGFMLGSLIKVITVSVMSYYFFSNMV